MTNKRKIASELLSEMVKGKLYEDGTEVTGQKTFIVNAMCMTPEAEDAIPQEFTVQAASPEDAKARAMAMSKEMNHTSCRIQDVTMVPNSGEELNDYGKGSAMNADPSSTNGQVMPSDVADVPDGDAKA